MTLDNYCATDFEGPQILCCCRIIWGAVRISELAGPATTAEQYSNGKWMRHSPFQDGEDQFTFVHSNIITGGK